MITVSTEFFIQISATVYDFVYKLYYFLFHYNIFGGQGLEVSYKNPFNSLDTSFRVPVFNGMRFIVEAIEKLFNIDLNVTPFGLIFGVGIFFILGYAVIKYLIPQ